jgi:NADH dehydrogenase
MAMPTFERKFRVILNWIISFFTGRDTTQLMDLDNPRGAFVAAATPAPKPAAAPAPAPVGGGSGSSAASPAAAEAKETVSAKAK